MWFTSNISLIPIFSCSLLLTLNLLMQIFFIWVYLTKKFIVFGSFMFIKNICKVKSLSWIHPLLPLSIISFLSLLIQQSDPIRVLSLAYVMIFSSCKEWWSILFIIIKGIRWWFSMFDLVSANWSLIQHPYFF